MRILIKGAGDLASGIAYECWLAGHKILMTELPVPLAVRRAVSFSRAVCEGSARVEDATAVLVRDEAEAEAVLAAGNLAVIIDETAAIKEPFQPDVVIDAIMAKRNTGTTIQDAPVVIGIGPGFTAGKDCHYVIETVRGPSLGKVIRSGSAAPDTGIPGEVGGYTTERLLRAAADGIMEPVAKIGDLVTKGQLVAYTAGVPVCAQLTGVVRGMLPKGVKVTKGLKIGDIDGRGDKSCCYLISDKARKTGRGVLECI